MNRETLDALRSMVLRGDYITNMDMLRKLFPHGLAWGNRLRGREVRCTSHRRRMFFRKTRWGGATAEVLKWWDASIT